MNPYPLAGDYQAALQNPDAAFTVTSLRRAQFAADSWGLPEAITGTSAAVFHATIGGDAYALRCFTRQDASSPERYAAFDSFVAGQGLGQHVGQVTWHDDAVRAKGATWPVLQMEWIEGQQLNEYVGYLAESTNADALGKLASRWLKLVDELQRAQFAHGDLQHGNVIIDQQGRLRLVDFDGVWIPPLQGHPPPTEIGHENYQPRGRSAQARWGPWMDTFSAHVIYVALTALARDPGLWLPLNNGDNLLFERKDFSAPFETGVWKHLARVGDAEVDRLADKLKTCCVPGWVATKSLTAMIEPTWWERTRVSPTPGTKASPAPVQPRAPVDSTPRQQRGLIGPRGRVRSRCRRHRRGPTRPRSHRSHRHHRRPGRSPIPAEGEAGRVPAYLQGGDSGLVGAASPDGTGGASRPRKADVIRRAHRRLALHHLRLFPVRRVGGSRARRGHYRRGRSRHRGLARQEQPEETTRIALPPSGTSQGHK